ncbi:MAG TPA: D-alanyl-D-alanine carboxypeptidase/D-alanyl-D-alanine-endopeptidase [Gemmatimonadaceae bacterium]|nr:D-alanyl-D-alanine carboxypeptidase/D-alanyl-D-alanine-endopeptidase [Gemmatimonadaceae bacterium]
MRSAHWRVLVLFGAAACAPARLGPAPSRDDGEALRQAIDSMLAAPDTRQARWGVLIVDPEARDTLYSRDAGKLLVPASNMKILTSAVALDVLGPDFRFATPLIARGQIRAGVLDGDLVVAGRGDPSVSDNSLGDAMVPLRAVADSLWARGLRRVRGRVLAGGNAFPDANAGTAWNWEDLDYSYGAKIDELLFNEGFAEIHVHGAERVGEPPRARTSPAKTFPRLRITATTAARGTGRDSVPRLDAVKDSVTGEVVLSGTIPVGDTTTVEVTFRDVSEAYLAALREALVDRGITVADSVYAAPASPADTVFVLRSPPLARILPSFMKPSQNQIGEMLFRTVALQRTDTGSERAARRIVGEHLRAWGADPGGFQVMDGSGLSRQDLVSPETIIHVLDAMRRGPHFQVYFDAMPVAGVDGTLRSRMRGTMAEGNVRGKTGTLNSVRSLSGYVSTAQGRVLLFSVLCNNYLVPTSYITRVQDSVAVRLSRLRIGGPMTRAAGVTQQAGARN